MKISLISTIKNELDNIDIMMQSISLQSKKPDEIIIVDAGSNDGSQEKLAEWKKLMDNLIVIIHKDCTRSEGRNLAIEKSSCDIIAAVDFGCALTETWLEEITRPILNNNFDVTAGYYYNGKKSIMALTNSYFTHPALFEINEDTFLASTRSMAFKKLVWESVGGFEPRFTLGEDTLFGITIRKAGFKICFNKNALVEWNAEESIFQMIKKLFNYSKWDGKGNFSKIFYYRMYLSFTISGTLLILAFFNSHILCIFTAFAVIYFFKSFINAKKKFIGFLPALLVSVLKPIYNIFQTIGFLYGRLTRIR